MANHYLQYIVNGIISGGILALPAIAFSLLYGILRFPNFAIGTYITAGGFIAYAANVTLGLPIPHRLSHHHDSLWFSGSGC